MWLNSLRAGFLLTRNQRTEAAKLYREMLESDPTHVPGLIAVLSDCVERNAVDDVIRVATRALAIDSRHFMALQTLGWAYASRGNHAAARPIVAMAREQYDAQSLGEVSRRLAGAARGVSRSPEGERGVGELTEWRRWADSYLAGGQNPTEDENAG